MKTRTFVFSFLLAALAVPSSQAQPFVGTNSPGQSTHFTFTLGAGATNLSLVISNSAAAYSWLFLTNGGVPPTTNNYEFTSRLVGLTNQINLEAPQFATGTYGLLVFTPTASALQSFSVALTTNPPTCAAPITPSPNRWPSRPRLPDQFRRGAWQYFQVDMPSNMPAGWRVVVSSTNATPPCLYLQRGQVPTTGN